MIRLIIEAGLIFLAPALIYVAIGVIRRRASRKTPGRKGALWRDVRGALDGAPFLWLFVLGASLVMLSLLAAETPSGGSPNQHYEPARIENGTVKQGHFE